MTIQDDTEEGRAGKGASLPQVLSHARRAIGEISASPIDSVRSCEKTQDGLWIATLELIESPARMGDNDLLTAYEMILDAEGELMNFRRVGRFYREEGAA